MASVHKTFTLDQDSAEKLAQLQLEDGFNASALVRRAIKKEYNDKIEVL